MVAPPCRRRFRLCRACDELALALAPGRLDSLAALYEGRHRREAPALRDTPYGSAQALISSPPSSFGCRPLVGLRVYPDQQTTSPAPALGSVVEAAPSLDTRPFGPLRTVTRHWTCIARASRGRRRRSWLPSPEGLSLFPDPFRLPAPGAVSWALWRKLPRLPALVDNPGTWRPLPYGKARNDTEALPKPPWSPPKALVKAGHQHLRDEAAKIERVRVLVLEG